MHFWGQRKNSLTLVLSSVEGCSKPPSLRPSGRQRVVAGCSPAPGVTDCQWVVVTGPTSRHEGSQGRQSQTTGHARGWGSSHLLRGSPGMRLQHQMTLRLSQPRKIVWGNLETHSALTSMMGRVSPVMTVGIQMFGVFSKTCMRILCKQGSPSGSAWPASGPLPSTGEGSCPRPRFLYTQRRRGGGPDAGRHDRPRGVSLVLALGTRFRRVGHGQSHERRRVCAGR